jgi:signal-transduction protein with cAMP-binding, CBS, and nucleotidyltransferase domain
MYIFEVSTGYSKKVVISQVNPADLTSLTRKRYFFTWKSLKQKAAIYKLHIEGEKDILGVMALEDHPTEKRIEIKLLASSIENKGKNKKYDKIAGCLIAYACRLSIDKYMEYACVSLVPKTELLHHYKQKYYMIYGGWQLYLEGEALFKLLKEYSYEL